MIDHGQEMIVSAIIKSIIRDRSQTWLLTLGLLITVASVVLLASASQTIVAQSQQDLSTYWRTTYDILVRPNGSVTDIEEKYGLVEANHLSGTAGGITFEQYEIIKSIPGIEVAAPIAMIGYLPQSLYTEEVGQIESPGAYVIEQYEVNEDGKRIFPGDDNVMRHFYYSGEDAQSSRSPNAPITEFGQLGGFVVFPILLAAIDPEQEAALVGLDQAMIEGKYLNGDESLFLRETGLRLEPDWPDHTITVPAIMNSTTYVDLRVVVEFKRIVLPTEGQDYQSIMNWGGNQFLRSLPAETLATLVMESQEAYVQLVNQIGFSPGSGIGTSHFLWDVPQRIKYAEIVAPSSSDHVALEVIMPAADLGQAEVDSEGRPYSFQAYLAYREFKDPGHPETHLDVVFEVKVKGIFNIEGIPRPTDVNRVPLETYFPPMAALLYDENGNLVPPTQLKPTINPAGYIVSPPMLLTTLPAAQAMIGDDAISAIRIRVAGIDELDEAAQKKIETIATTIIEKTGLTVDIMVGSSPTRVVVYVPEVGYVEEQWIQKNVDLTYTKRIQSGHIAMLATSGLVAGLFTLEFAWADVIRNRKQLALYKALGWRTSTVFTYILARGFFFGLIGILAGLAAAVPLVDLLNLEPLPNQIWLWILAGGVLLCLLGCVYPAYAATRVFPVEGLREDAVRGDSDGAGLRITSLFSLAMQGLLRRKVRTTISATVAGLAAFLLVVMLAVTFERQGVLAGTLLGEFILLNIRATDYILASTGLVLAGLSTLASLLSSVFERKREIGVLKSVGWTSGDVTRLFLFEGASLGLAGGALGTALGVVTYMVSFGLLRPTSLWILPAGILMPAAVCLLCSIYPAQIAGRQSPAEAIRAA